MKFILQLVAVVMVPTLIGAAIILWLAQPPEEYREFSGEGFFCEAPKDAETTASSYQGWVGHEFSGYGNSGVYFLTPDREPDAAMLKSFADNIVHGRYTRDVPLLAGAVFVLEAIEDHRNYIYIINSGMRVFWVVSRSRDPLEPAAGQVAGRIAISLQADGETTDIPAAQRVIAEINNDIRPFIPSRMKFVAMQVGLVFSGSLGVALILFYLSMLPKEDRGTVIRKASNIYVVRKKKGKMNLVGAAVLTDRELTVYCFRRHLVTVQKGHADRVSLAPRFWRNIVRIEQGDLTVDLLVSNPEQWLTDITNFLS